MNTLNSDMSNGNKRLNCLDFVKLPNHTQFLLLKYEQINKRFNIFELLARNDDAAYVVSNADHIKCKQCGNYVEFSALFSFTLFNQLARNLMLM